MKQKTISEIEIINLEYAIPAIKAYLLDLQNRLTTILEQADGEGKFIEDTWVYNEGGGGRTCVLNSAVIEKCGVNFSHVYGKKLPQAATLRRPYLADAPYQALGVSVVIHPTNPYAPSSHFNVRFIVVENSQNKPYWWFGGGFDLTPYYGFVEDCMYWHRTAKAACEPFGLEVYPKFKKWADDYFFLKHRQEPRGIGGIFFDDINAWGFERCFAFMRSVGEHFIEAYHPILTKRKHQAFTQKERDFQLYRRGRYVEYNLLYDRGTLFGLQSAGRTESILMSLPPLVAWHYNWQPSINTKEATFYEDFLRPRDWLNPCA